MTDSKSILEEIVAVQQRIYDRYAGLRKEVPGSVSDGELDEKLLDLLQAKLELVQHMEKK